MKIHDTIKKYKTDYAEIRIEEREHINIEFVKDRLEEASKKFSLGASVRVYKNGGWGFTSFNSLDNLDYFFKTAVDMAELIGKSKQKSLSTLADIENKNIKIINKNYKIDPTQIPLSLKVEQCQKYNEILLKGKYINSTRTNYKETKFKKTIYFNDGREMYYEDIYLGIRLSAIARKDNLVIPYGDSFSGYTGYEIIKGREMQAEEIREKTAKILLAKPVIGGVYDVVIGPKLTGVFAHEAFGHLSEADAIYENERLRKIMKIGTRFGYDKLNIIDDGSIPAIAGYIPFDDEGVIPRKIYLIKNGILAGRLHSRETAAKMNEPLTGSARAISYAYPPIVRMSNTYIDSGPDSKETLISSIDNGIYAEDYTGGMTNLEMFTFSAGIAYLIKNGKIDDMVRDVTLSGNVFTTLKSIDGIADDLKMFGGLGGCGKGGQMPLPVTTGGPSIRIKNVVIGGK